jgi:ribosome-binding factor A
MGPSQRQLRAGELVRHALVDVLAREDLRDPDLSGVSVTLGEVRCSPDLKHATVFCIPLGLGTKDGERIAAALNRASPFLRGRLARRIAMKFTPELRFVMDTSYDAGVAMDRLLDRVKAREDEGEGDPD